MNSELRKYFYDHYNGFSDKGHKNVECDYSISIHDFGEGDVIDHVTFINLNVIDNKTLKISFFNNLQYNFPNTASIKEILQQYDTTIENQKISIVFNKDDYRFLRLLIGEFQRYYSNSPNYAWIKPRLVKSLEKLINLLDNYK
jgi:hypothetical protein